MHTKETYAKLEEVIRHYGEELSRYSDEQFNSQRDELTWSVGQMYEHLLSSGYQLFFKKIKACLSQQHGSWEGEKNKDGARIFASGSFPPIKIKIPEAWLGPSPVAKPRDTYQASLLQFLSEARQLGSEIAQGDTGYKTNHVALGMLTASEWFQMIEIHFRHHLRQKNELDEYLRALTEISS
ncbi:MAG: DinB family protein [Bacteroidota bacterium]